MICSTSSCPMIFESSSRGAAYRRELERPAARSAASAGAAASLPRWARGGLPSPIFTAVLLVVATTGLLLSVFAPVTQESQRARRSARWPHPKQAVGHGGGLLPDVELVSDSNPLEHAGGAPGGLDPGAGGLQVRCRDPQIVTQVNAVPPAALRADRFAGQRHHLTALASAVDDGRGSPVGVRDVDSTLAKTYHASATAPTLLFVAGDGTLASAPRVFHSGDRIEGLLGDTALLSRLMTRTCTHRRSSGEVAAVRGRAGSRSARSTRQNPAR